MTLDSLVWVGMCIRHLVHRHEPPVLNTPVQVCGRTRVRRRAGVLLWLGGRAWAVGEDCARQAGRCRDLPRCVAQGVARALWACCRGRARAQVLRVLPDWVAVVKPAGMPVHTVGDLGCALGCGCGAACLATRTGRTAWEGKRPPRTLSPATAQQRAWLRAPKEQRDAAHMVTLPVLVPLSPSPC